MGKCDIEVYRDKGFVECNKLARWIHPRWPAAMYCQQHKETLEAFWPNDWKRIKENENGK